MEVHYDAAGRRHRLEFGFSGHTVDYVHDGQLLHSPPSDLAVVHLKETAFQRRRRIDDLEAISEGLGIDPHIIRNLAGEMARNGPPDLRTVRFDDEESTEWDVEPDREAPYTALHVRIHDRPNEQYYGTLSGSEKQRVLIEFACALARERCRSAPTLLLLDGSGWSFDNPYMAVVASWLLKQPFQTIMTLNDSRRLDDDPVWKSWGQVFLDRPKGAAITTII